MGKYNDFPPGAYAAACRKGAIFTCLKELWSRADDAHQYPDPPWAPFWQPTVVPKFRQPYRRNDFTKGKIKFISGK